MPQLRLLWHSTQRGSWSQRGHGSHARRPRSACGSIGNTGHRPVREHARAHQVVVDPLLVLVETGIEHVPRQLFFGEHLHRIPIVADRLEHRGPSARLVERQVVRKRQVIRLIGQGNPN